MRVFLDENIDPRLSYHLHGVMATSIFETECKGLKNGELLKKINGKFDVFVTRDSGLPHQQNLSKLHLGVVVVRTKTPFFEELLSLSNEIVAACRSVKMGQALSVPL